MRKVDFNSQDFWNDSFTEETESDTLLLYMTLITAPERTIPSIFKITKKRLSFYTKIPLERLDECFKSLKENQKAIYSHGYVFLKNGIKFNGTYMTSKVTQDSLFTQLSDIPKEVIQDINEFVGDDIVTVYQEFVNVINSRPRKDKKQNHSTSTPTTPPTSTPTTYDNDNDNVSDNDYDNDNNILNNVEEKKSKKNIKVRKYKDEALEVLEIWNEVKNTKYKSIEGFYDNFEKWLDKTYSLDEIKESIRNTPLDKGFMNKVKDPSTFFRHKNPNGESVDYIGRCLQFDHEEAEDLQEGFDKFMEYLNKLVAPKSFLPSDTAKNQFEEAIRVGITPQQLGFVLKEASKDKQFRGENIKKVDYFRPETITKLSVIQDFLNRKKGGGG